LKLSLKLKRSSAEIASFAFLLSGSREVIFPWL